MGQNITNYRACNLTRETNISKNASGLNTNTWQFTGQEAQGNAYNYQILVRSAPGKVVGVQPIFIVTRAPGDATYTDGKDTYTSVGVAPTNAILTASKANASGGNSSWVVQSNVQITYLSGATTSNAVPTLCPSLFPVSSVDRIDGGPGKLFMLRTYATTNATSRQQVIQQPFGGLTNNQLFDTYTPLAGDGQMYYAAGLGDVTSTNQSQFGTFCARTSVSPIIGAKFFYAVQGMTIMNLGDSTAQGYVGSTPEAGIPDHYGWAKRGMESLHTQGFMIDMIDSAVSGATWQQFSALALSIINQGVIPDVCIMPAFTPNGGTGITLANTQACADQQYLSAMSLRDTLISKGVKDVILTVPFPNGLNVAVSKVRDYVRSSGYNFIDMQQYLSDGSGNWLGGYGVGSQYYSIDGTHPNSYANIVMAQVFADTIKSLYM